MQPSVFFGFTPQAEWPELTGAANQAAAVLRSEVNAAMDVSRVSHGAMGYVGAREGKGGARCLPM